MTKKFLIILILVFSLSSACSTTCQVSTVQHEDKYDNIEDTNVASNIITLDVTFSEEISGNAALFPVAKRFFENKVEDMFGVEVNWQDSNDIGKHGTNDSLIAEAYIAFQNENKASILFKGTYAPITAAHPTHFMWSLNYNPITLVRYRFSDIYKVDSMFYRYFQKEAEASILESTDGKWPYGWGEFSQDICPEDSFIEGMSTEREFQFYFGEESISIIYPVPFALGNYFVVDMAIKTGDGLREP